MGTVTSRDGTIIEFSRSGEGPPVVMVNGGFHDRSASAPLAALLAPYFSVTTYDRRGRGGSGDTPPYSIQAEVDDIDTLIGAAGGPVALFGYSSGAHDGP